MKKLFVTLLFAGFISFIPSSLHLSIPFSLSAQIPSDGLVAWYPFNGNANDESGNGNHGVVNGATLTADRFGNSNSAFSFSKQLNNSISFSTNFVGNGNSTISGWVKSVNPSGGTIVHIGADNFANLYCNGYSIGLGTTSFFSGSTFLSHVSCTGFSSTGINANASEWYFFTLTRDQNVLTTYINGNLVNVSIVNTIIAPSNFAFFGSTFSSNADFFNGVIDNVSIYNRSLSETEIQQLYQDQTGQLQSTLTCNIIAPTTTLCEGESVTLSVNTTGGAGASSQLPANLQQGLVAYYPFNGNANDESGNGHDGAVNGATLTSDRFGNVASAYSFDGQSNFIDLGDMSDAIDGLGSFSLNYWMNSSFDFDLFQSWQVGGVFSHWVYNAQPTSAIGFQTSIYGSRRLALSVVGGEGVFSSLLLNVNQNTMVSLVFNGTEIPSQRFSLYVDGEFMEYVTPPTNIQQFGTIGNKTVIGGYIGFDGVDNVYFYFKGILDDIALFNRALSPSEIQQLYNVQSYAWSNNATTPTITVAPTANTIYTCTVTQGNQTCTDSVDITVNPNVTNSISATIIEGETYILGTQTLTTSGTYTEVFTSATGCDSTLTLTLNVDPFCNIQVSKNPICLGDAIELTALSSIEATGNSIIEFLFDENDLSSFSNTSVMNHFNDNRLGPFGNQSVFYNNVDIPQHDSITIEFDLLVISTWDGNGDANRWGWKINGQNQILTTFSAYYNANQSFPGSYPSNYPPTSGYSYGIGPINGGFNTYVYSFKKKIPHNSNTISFEWYALGLEAISNESWALDNFKFTLHNSSIQNVAWNNNATTPTITVSPTQNTTYTCTVTQGNQTCTASVDITVNPNITNSISATIIEGETYILGTQTLSTAGTYTEVFTSAAGCDSTVTLTLNVEPLLTCNITAPTTTLCEGESVTLSVNTTGGAGASSQLPANLQQGLVAYYPFNGNANDESGNSNVMLVNNCQYTTDRNGQTSGAIQTQGNNGSYLEILSSPSINSNTFTWSLWVKFSSNTYGGGGYNLNPGIMSRTPAGTTCNGATIFEAVSRAGSQNLVCNGNVENYGCGSFPTIGNNEWHHVAMIVNPGYGSQFYIDGMPQTSVFTPSYFTVPFNQSIRVGRPTDLYWKAYFGGVDDIAIYNRALSPSEIQQLYTAQSYAWSNNATTPTITVTPSQNTTYSCTVTQGNSTCTASVDITVNPNVTNTISATIIEGGSYTLGAQTLTSAGTYTEVFTSAAGCDSTVTLILSTTSPCLPSYVPTNGLVGYWPFCGNADDASGNGNNGTVNGATLTMDRNGNGSSAFSFSSSNFIDCGNSESFAMDQGLTYSCWGRTSVSSNNISIGGRWTNVNNPPPYGTPEYCLVFSNNSVTSAMVITNPPAEYASAPFDYADGQWHFYSMTYDGSVNKLYIDGELSAMINAQGSIQSSVNKFIIGTYTLAGNPENHTWQGQIDEVGLWNRALTSQEIQALYLSGQAPCTPVSNSISATIIQGQSYTLGTQTLTTAGTYTEVFTSASGCDSTVTLTLSVNPSPLNCNITASTTTLCEGESVTLSVNTTGGPSASSQLPANLQQGLVAYYPFNGNANDESGNGNNGTVNGATLTSDRFGNANGAYSFDGVNDFIQVTNNNPINTFEYTLSAWFNISSDFTLGGSGPGFYHYILDSRPGGVWLNVAANNIQTSCGVTATSISTNSWHHLSCCINQAGSRVYLDGIELAINPITGIQLNNLNTLNFGKRFSNTEFLIGSIDEVAIYNRALSPAEIQQLYTAQSYAWSTNETTTTITVSPSTSTTYSCTVSQGNQTCTANVDITVNPNVINAISATIIEGETYTLGAQTLTTAGTYTEVFTYAAGCDSTVTLTLSVNPSPLNCNITAPTITLCEGESVTLSVNTIGGAGASSQLPANLQQGLVAYYPFNGNANDESGNGNNGVVNGATLTTDRFGNVGSAYGFDGLNDKIIVSNSPTINNFSQQTISVWVENTPQTQGFFLSKGCENNQTQNVSYRMYSTLSSNTANIYTTADNWTPLRSYASVELSFSSGFVNYISVYDGAYLRLYKNGILISEVIQFGNIQNTPGDMAFGCRLHTNASCLGDNYFSGVLDDIAIYNRALTPAEIQQLYSAQSYAWSNNATTPTITVTPSQNTTYSCTVTQGNQTCTANVDITVNPNVTNAISATIIEGETYTLGAQTLTTAGTYTEVFTSANGCDSTVTLTLSVEPLLTCEITAPTTTLCEGESVTLSVNTTGGAGASSQLPANLQQGLVAYYPFNGNANDESGNGNDGVVNGATLTSDRFGNVNSAYSFLQLGVTPDNVQNVSVALNSIYAPSNYPEYSYAFWINSANDNLARVFQYTGLNNKNFEFVRSELSTLTNSYSFWHYDVGTSMASPTALENGLWKHIVICIKNNNSVDIYKDATYWFSGNISVPKPDNGTLMIGSQSNGYYGFSGMIDDFIVYGRSLSLTEIQQLYTAQSYVWSNNATTPTITVSPTQSTTYTCTITQGNQTCTASVDITVNPNVTNAISATIIEGETYTLGSQTLTTAGTYSEVFTSVTGCDSTVTLTLAVEPLLTCNVNASSVLVCGGESLTLELGLSNHTIGDFVGGGYLFYISEDGLSGMVGYPQSLSVCINPNNCGTSWGCQGINLSNCNGTSIGDGYNNTLEIISQCAQDDIAAKLCWDLNVNGFDDWYLPSKDELNEIYLNRNLLPPSMSLGEEYWSSSQYNSYTAWEHIFSSGLQAPNPAGKSDLGEKCLAIRNVNFSNYSISWSTNATTPTITVSPTQSTTYTCTVTEGNQTCTASVDITVNPNVTNTISATIIEGETYTLGAQTLTTAGTYTEVFTSAAGCDSTVTLTLSVEPLLTCNITAPATTLCEGESVTLSVNTTGGVGASSQLPANLQQGLVAYYPFNGNANDESGNGNNGVVNGATLTSDRFGNASNAYDFDGVSDFISTNFPGIIGNMPRTISVWFNTTQLHTLTPPQGWQNDQMVLLSYGSELAGGMFDCSLNSNCQGISLDVSYGLFTRSVLISDGQWHNVVYQYEGLGNSHQVKFYLDGNIIDLNGYCSGGSYVQEISTGSNLPVRIGSYSNAQLRLFKGQMDDIAVYNRALTPSEIQQLYNAQSYAWSTNATTPTITVSPTQTTTYTATVTTATQTCTDSITITVNPLLTWYADADADGFGNSGNALEACDQPQGFVSNANDCNDSEALAYSGAVDLCDNGIDEDCSGTDSTCIVLGCTDITACNFNPAANTDDASCTYPLQTYLTCDGACINDTDGDGVCDEIEIAGCTDPTAFNYNPQATNDDGSCEAVLTCDVTAPVTEICEGEAVELNFTPNFNPSIGDFIGGGYLFYISDDGLSGLVGYPEILAVCSGPNSCGAAWGCQGTLLSGCNGTAIGTGLSNTQAIVNQCAQSGTAARLCWDLVANGFDDWYLPSRDELNEIYIQRNLLTGALKTGGELWTSSQFSAFTAWEQRFGNGSQLPNPFGKSDLGEQCLAIRNVSFPANGLLWSTNATTPTINVSPTHTTTYTATVTTATQTCTDSITITVNPLLTWYADTDGDGFGDSGNALEACDQPQGFVSNANDCNDSEALAYSGAVDLCDNGIDEDCSGTDSTCIVLGCTDITACNFNPAANTDDASCTYPLQTYLTCDGFCINDSDGDGVCDEIEIAGCTDATAFNYNPQATNDDGSCEAVLTCDVTAPVTEICEGEGVELTLTSTASSAIQNLDNLTFITSYNGHDYYLLEQMISWEDAKLYGDQNGLTMYIVNNVDESNFVYQSLPYLGSDNVHYWLGLYQDLSDPTYSEPAGGWKWVDGTYLNNGFSNWQGGEPNNAGGENYAQFDWGGDGIRWNDAGFPAQNGTQFSMPIYEIGGGVYTSGNLNWSTGATTPTINVSPTQTTTYTATVTTATQTCTDSITITVNPLLTWYADADADGFGNPDDVVQDCNQPLGYTSDNTDCNDEDAATYPGAAEICDNNRDENCDGVDSLCFVPILGCTDINACNFNPDANTEDGSCVLPQPEICNAIDDNCNGQVDEGFSVESLNVVPVTSAIFPVCVGNAVKSANLNTGANSGVIAGEGNDLWFSFTAQNNAVRVGLSAATGDNEIQIFQLNNGCLQWLQTEHETYTSSTLATGNQTLITDELIAGNTYYVAIHHISGPINTSAKVCFNHFVASTCDHYYSNNTGIYPSVCSSFKAQYQANAIAYRFEVLSATQNNINQNITPWSYTTTSSSSVISRLGNILPANMGASAIQYTMQVPVLYSIPDAAGNLTNIEASATQTCQVQLSSQPTIALRLTDRCPTNKSLTSTIAPDRTVCGAMRYDWEFTEVLPVQGTPQVIPGGTNATVFFLSNVPGITVGKTYSVRVRPVHISNTAGQWGTAYCLRVGAAGMMNHPGSADAEPPLLSLRAGGEMNASYAIYPNPTSTGSFVLQYNGKLMSDEETSDEEIRELVMMDITGKVVFKTNVVLNGNIAEIHFGDLESGLYLVDFGGERSRVQVVR